MKNINDLNITVSKEIGKYTSHSFEIAIMILNYINQEDGGSKTKFAERVNKSRSEITRWLSGNHNFTILTIALIEARTGMEIINSLTKSEIRAHIESRHFKMIPYSELETKNQELETSIAQLQENIALLSQQKMIESKDNFWKNRNYKKPSVSTKSIMNTNAIVFDVKQETGYSISSSQNNLLVQVTTVQLTN